MSYVEVLQNLIRALSRLPGIGPRSAERVAFHILRMSLDEAKNLSSLIVEVKDKVSYCPDCHNLIQDAECKICSDGYRDRAGMEGPIPCEGLKGRGGKSLTDRLHRCQW